MHKNRKDEKWYHWYVVTDSPAERKLLLKLDLLILPYAFVMFWIYYIDSANIGNAWVGGMATELGFKGNQLVQFQTISQAASTVATLPFTYFFTRVKMQWLVPGLQFSWGIFTLLQFRANSYTEFMVYRFFVGLFEGPFYIAVQYVLATWYRGDEFGRRGCLWWFGLPLGYMTAGLIQSSASNSLDGNAGLSGWRWMFIIVSIMTLVSAVIGFFLWPGTPDRPNRLVLTEDDILLARTRQDKNGTGSQDRPSTRFPWKVLKATLRKPTVYILVIWQVAFWNADPFPWNGYLLWLDDLGRFSDAQINRIGVTAPALGIVYAIVLAFGSDLWLGRTPAILLANTANVTAMTILIIWNVPEAAKWFAYNLQFCIVPLASVVWGWANDITRHSKEECAITLGLMQVFPNAIRAWIGLLVFKTVEAPHFLKGNSFLLANSLFFALWTVFAVRPLSLKIEQV